MYLTDNHMHTTFSPDALFPMADMAQKSAENGMSEICFTDHIEDCSVNDTMLSFGVSDFSRWDEYFAEYEKVRDMLKGKLDVRIGAEFSSINHMPEKAKKLYDTKKLDFVIGSVHNIRDMDDFYYLKYRSPEESIALTERYLDECIEVANLGCCDILGHIGYHQKYAARQGVRFSIMSYEEKLRELFSIIIQNGIGIELNTSGMRDALGDAIPEPAVLRLYRECGGEIITVGSDSHNVETANADIVSAYKLLADLGYKYVTAFKEHKPEFLKI